MISQVDRTLMPKRMRVRRGSAIVFAVVSLVLLVLLGTSYLQMARVERLALSHVSRGNIDVVRAAVTAQIAQVLYDDLTNQNDEFFDVDPAGTGSMSGQLGSLSEPGDEPYDYPWTNDDDLDSRNQYKVQFIGGGQQITYGGHLDDAWLAATAPDFSNPAPAWPHITNLGHLFLHLPQHDLSGSTAAQPLEFTANNRSSNREQHDTDVRLLGGTSVGGLDTANSDYQFLGADADGDRIRDSKWTWAPIRQIGAVRYVMAVSIVDMSSMLNTNVALSQVDSGLNYDVLTEAPRWWYPSELDLGSFVLWFGDLGKANELRNLLRYRLADPASPNLTPWAERLDFWLDGPGQAFPTVSDTPLWSLVDERKELTPVTHDLELRYRRGLNEISTFPIIEDMTDGLHTFLRQDVVSSERTYTDYTGGSASLLNMQRYFVGDGTPAFPLGNPRLYLTTVSGTGHHMPVPSVSNAQLLLELPNLWHKNPVLRNAARDDFVALLRQSDMPFYADSSLTMPYGDAEIASRQLLACLIDYFDGDNNNPPDLLPDEDSRITKIVSTVGAVDRFGMEALPFLTEVYVHGAYHLTAANEVPGPGTGTYDFTWTLQLPLGYAIEMVNPFMSRVRNLEHVRLVVNGTTVDTLYNLLGAVGNKWLESEGGLVLYRDSAGVAGAIAPAVASPSGYTAAPVNWREKAITHDLVAADTDIRVELQVLVEPASGGAGGTQWVTYSRIQRSLNDVSGSPPTPVAAMAPDRLWLPQVVDKTNVILGVPNIAFTVGTTAYERFVQVSAFCDGQGLNPLAVVVTAVNNETNGKGTGNQPADFADPGIASGVEMPNPLTPQADLGQVGTLDKSPSSLVDPWQNFDGDFTARAHAFDDVAVRFVTDITRVVWVGPTETETYAEVFRNAAAPDPVSDHNGNQDELRGRMLDIHNHNDMASALDEPNYVPRAALMLDRITTIPVDRSRTSLIAGRININTATANVLHTALPLNDSTSTLKHDLIAAILEMRKATNLPMRTRNNLKWQGFASLGELLQLTTPVTDPITLQPIIDSWARDNGFTDVHDGVQVAFDGGSTDLNSGPSDDRTEEVRLMGFLSNVCSVRSDIYCAYVLIRGYPASDFRSGPVEATQFFVLYDRSQVTKAGDDVRVLGTFKIY